MAYDVPTTATLKAKYPAFAGVADETVQLYLDDAAANGVDTSWREADYAPAILSLAAHRMALLNIGDHGQVAGYARQGVTSLRSGSFGVSLDPDKAKAAASGSLDATAYGQEYRRLLGANRGGPIVVTTRLTGGTGPFYRQNNGVVIP